MDRLVKSRHVERYRYPQKIRQLFGASYIFMHVAGFAKLRYYSPSGKLLIDWDGKRPFILLHGKGGVMDFHATEQRDNWAIFLALDFFRWSKSEENVLFDHDGDSISLPVINYIDPVRLPEWEQRFQQILDAWKDPIPLNRFRTGAGIIEILFLLFNKAHPMNIQYKGPEGHLKRLIDEDFTSQNNLSELSEKCGYSSDHLRELFHKRYQISPMAYRQKLRMSQAMDLVASSSLSVKQIARQVGFRYETHFCTAFKKEYEITPLQAIKEKRL